MDPIWDLSLSEAFTHPATIHILSNNQPIWLQPQPQLDATVPLNRKRNKARKYPEEDWEAQKQEITRLYEKNTLDSIMKLMKERHGFDPSPKQYKDHIKKWGLNKNVQTHEMEAIIKMQNNRLLESGKQSAFRVRKRPVPPGKISRYIKEHRKEIILDNESNVGGSKSPAATPGAISCYTPSETGPVTPHAAPCPLASLSPQPSFSHQGPHSSSYQFGDPGPILPSSSWVAQITGGSHMQHSSPIPIAASPTASSSALVEVEESTFTGQSPAPFSVPSTPQAYNHDLLQDEAMEVNTLAIMWNTACVLERQGKYSMAERMHRLALQLKENVLGHEHPDTLASMGKLAWVLESQGRYRAAEQMERQTLQLNQKVLGPNHPDTLTSMDRLTLVLEKQGRYTAAEQMGRQALDLREKVLGSEHPDTLTSMRTLALVLVRLGRYMAAERMARQALELRQKILGPEHPDTLMSMNNLALVLERLRRHSAAERTGRQALELRQKILGPEHPDTLMSMNNLAMALSGQGQNVEAEEMDRHTLELRQKVLGPEHPDTLMSMNNLAAALTGQGKYVEAEEINRQTLELSQKVLGPEHPDTLMSINNLAVAVSRQGKYEAAEPL